MEGNRDIVVMGGSAGAIEVIGKVLEALPVDFGAAVFIAIHMGSDSPGLLAEILARHSKLPVHFGADHDPIELGKVYIAPRDRHLLVKPGEVRVIFGPKENSFRPAIDPLFRSAATTYDGRVIGVVVSGSMEDGSHGLLEIKRAGGIAIVQSPAEAAVYEMPQSALRRVDVDHVSSTSEIGPLLCQLINENVEVNPSLGESEADISEGLISALRMANTREPSPFICPECNGALWEVRNGNVVHYRCHVGHGFGANTLMSLQATAIEQALWSAVRGFEERAILQKRTAATAPNPEMRHRLMTAAGEQQSMADLVRSILVKPQSLNHANIGESVRREYT